MKLLLLSDARSPHTVAIANNLRRRNVDLRVVSLRPPIEGFFSDVEVCSFGTEESVEPQDIEKAAILAQQIVDSWHPDYVNSHYLTIYGKVAYRLRNCRHIASVWGTDILVRPLRSAAERKFVGRVLSEAEAVFATSNLLARAARPFTKAPIFNTPFGVDQTAGEHPKEGPRYYANGRASGDPIILTCAKWLREPYGLDTAIDTVALLKKRGITAKLRLAGDGPLRQELAERARVAGVAAQIEFCGHLGRDRIPDFHRSGHLGFYPSRHESFGVSLLESLHHGTPVVASNVGGIPEILWSSTYSRMGTVDDPTSFADAIQEMTAEEGYYSQACHAARKHAQKFLWDRTVEYFVAALRTLDETKGSLANMVFPGPRQIEAARSKGLCIFYCPTSMSKARRSITMQRRYAIRKALAKEFSLISAVGPGVLASGIAATVQFYAWFGVKPSFAYTEGNTTPDPASRPSRRFVRARAKYSFLRALARQGIPLICYLPVFDDEYGAHGSTRWTQLRRYWRRFLYRLDISIIGRIADRIAVQSMESARRFPRHIRSKLFLLPPGASLSVGGYRQTDRIKNARNGSLKILYAGRLNAAYDIFPFLAACKALAENGHDIELGLFCPRADYVRHRSSLAPIWMEEEFLFFPWDADRIERVSPKYNLASMAVRPAARLAGIHPVECYNYVSAGLPVICSEALGFSKVISRERIGWTTSGSVLDIARTLVAILENPEDYARATVRVHEFKLAQSWSLRANEIYAQAVGAKGAQHDSDIDDQSARSMLPPAILPPAVIRRCNLMQEKADAVSASIFGRHAAKPKIDDGRRGVFDTLFSGLRRHQ